MVRRYLPLVLILQGTASSRGSRAANLQEVTGVIRAAQGGRSFDKKARLDHGLDHC